MLMYYIGVLAALAGIGVNVVMVAISIKLSTTLKQVDRRTREASDKRMNVLAMIIDGMKAVKFFAWEESFFKMIESARNKVVQYISLTS
eukprot:SAG31_NODE_320_length_17748_cov_4.201881_13_plen_89_part_00